MKREEYWIEQVGIFSIFPLMLKFLMDDCDGRVICPVYSRFAAKNMSKESPDCPRAEARDEFYIKV